MKDLNNTVKSIVFYILSFVLPAAIIVVALIGLGITPFGDNTLLISDGNSLYINYLSYVGRVIKGVEGFTYSFEKGLGGNMMDSWGWFLMNPSFALFVFFDVTKYPIVFTIVSILNFSVCGLTMYILLIDIHGCRFSNLFFSTSYAMNGFLVANVFQMNFFTGVCILPLMVLGLRKIIKDENPLLYILSLAYSLFTNFYFGFMLCVASLLFFTVTIVIDGCEIKNKKNIVVKYTISSLLAGLMSSVIWLPALLALQGGRLEQTTLAEYSFSENMPFLEIGAKFFSGTNSQHEMQDGLPNVFVGIFPIALVLLFFISNKTCKRLKIKASILLSVYLLSFYIVAFDMVMHGGTTTNYFNFRYSFVFSFLLLLIAAREWTELPNESLETVKKVIVIILVSTIIIFYKEYEFISGGVVVLDLVILAIMTVALWMHRKDPIKNTRFSFEIIVLIMVSVNLLLNYRFSTANILQYCKSYSEFVDTVTPVNAMIEAVKETDDSFYRMEIDEQRTQNHGNDTMLYGYYGVGHGGSDARNNVRTMLSQLGVKRFDMRNSYGKGIPAATDTFLGLKYIVSRENLQELKDYVSLGSLDDWGIYENSYTLPVAMVSDSKIFDVELDFEDVFQNLNNVWMAISGNSSKIFTEENNISFSSHNLIDPYVLNREEAEKIVSKRDEQNGLHESYSMDYASDNKEIIDGIIRIDDQEKHNSTVSEMPTDSSYIMYTCVASEDGHVYSYNRSGLMDELGSVEPALHYEGYYKQGDIITGFLKVDGDYVSHPLLEDVAGRFRIAYENINTLKDHSAIIHQKSIFIDKTDNTSLKGEFSSDEGQVLMFTIPYDEGWTLTIDGQNVEIKQVMGALMAAETTAGTHIYELKFVPSGLKLSGLISVSAIIGMVFFLYLSQKDGHLLPQDNKDRSHRMERVEERADNTNGSGKKKMVFSEKLSRNIIKNEWAAVVFVIVIVLVIGSSSLTQGLESWGDDHAAYINEGIAIAEGNFQEQASINYYYHPSPLPKEAKKDLLVYSWGYPLIQAVVYKIVGFDYSAIIWYKLPLVICLALTGGILVLFFRRRFSLLASIVMSLLFCFSGDLFESMNILYSDVPFLFFCLLTLLLIESFLAKIESGNIFGLSIITGFSLWLTYETRLNGIAVCAIALLGYIFSVFQNKVSIKKAWKIVIPYLIMIALVWVSEHCWLATATSNMSDFTREVLSERLNRMGQNIDYYAGMVFNYFSTLNGFVSPLLGGILILACIIGIVIKGFKENLYLTFFLFGTIFAVVSLPYTQGLRYMYSILPIFIMFLAYGIRYISDKLFNRIVKVQAINNIKIKKIYKRTMTIALVGVMAISCICKSRYALYNINHFGEIAVTDVYSSYATELYNYIKNEIPYDKTIAFAKPRILYMNTRHMSFRPGVNGHELTSADYYLETKFTFVDFIPFSLESIDKETVFDNSYYTLYKLL